MRVLFTSLEGSHFQLLAPLAWALRTAGHEVRAVCVPGVVETVTRAGITAVPIESPSWYEGLEEFHKEAIAHFGTADQDRDPDREETWEEQLGYESVIVPALNSRLNSDQVIDEMVAFARHWRPDLVVWETLCLAGPIAALTVGAAHARLVSGPELAMQLGTRRAFRRLAAEQPPEHREDPTAEWLNWTLERLGARARFDESTLTGQWLVDTRPASLREDLGLPVVPARYIPYNGRAVVPRWLREPPTRPRVCLTLGVSIDSGYGLWDLDAILAGMLGALADADVEVVAALSERQRAHLPPLPDTVRVVDHVPMHDLLPTCAAVVHHGGYQTKATAEFHGVPQLLLTGWEWVTESMGTAYEKQGNLLALPLREFTADRFRRAIARVLEAPSFQEHAQRLRWEIAGMPTPNEAVAEIERLTRRHGKERRAS
ncbi:activator-dependent family glycosyltransferase [Streptomyces pseudovenezuelae]|uniref:Glycosyltransferase (Activator-dependent family) n=1 Tax=Streptomyces pseudovenezuelae TaxID=67350 RepID=A0ABT6LA56_9ACTN|nr:activator-dependent family glycosyltransferase [Streptomyces pseudovenezuelae]MDH6213178.1 glycosyltransferase (activator-dependent family) [Streptomyces pseudovenezuelae]